MSKTFPVPILKRVNSYDRNIIMCFFNLINSRIESKWCASAVGREN